MRKPLACSHDLPWFQNLWSMKSRVKKDVRDRTPHPRINQLLHRAFLPSPSLLPPHMTAPRPSFFHLILTLAAALTLSLHI